MPQFCGKMFGADYILFRDVPFVDDAELAQEDPSQVQLVFLPRPTEHFDDRGAGNRIGTASLDQSRGPSPHILPGNFAKRNPLCALSPMVDQDAGIEDAIVHPELHRGWMLQLVHIIVPLLGDLGQDPRHFSCRDPPRGRCHYGNLRTAHLEFPAKRFEPDAKALGVDVL